MGVSETAYFPPPEKKLIPVQRQVYYPAPIHYLNR